MKKPSPIKRALQPLQQFLKLEAASGIVLLAATVLAMIVANSSLAGSYQALLEIPFTVKLGEFGLSKSLWHWINDGLMAIFFFVVGLELKREMMEGHLSSFRRAALPAFAAAGGMAAPATIYLILNYGDAAVIRGWAIPTATDIAFALAVLALAGKAVPPALKAFLLSVAIFDDLGAIIIIAFFYTAGLSLLYLIIAFGLVLLLAALNRSRVTRPALYFLIGVPLWFAVLKSGVHATIAGVALAMFIPLKPRNQTESLLHRLEHSLHPWVAFGVLPIFAFANAGVSLAKMSTADLFHAAPLGIILGLFVGKQIGIMLLCVVAVALKVGSLPEGVRWPQLYGVAIICGIGFTMSLFIASLASREAPVDPRLSILIGSLVSGLAGFLVLRFSLRARAA